MLLLLPLRGWAASAMPGSMADTLASAELPCHVATLAEGDAGPGLADAAAETCCIACDLCHGTAAGIAVPVLTPTSPPVIAPHAAPVHDTGRVPADRLDRPPRHFHA